MQELSVVGKSVARITMPGLDVQRPNVYGVTGHWSCHPERSEGSPAKEILRFRSE